MSEVQCGQICMTAKKGHFVVDKWLIKTTATFTSE